MIYLMIDLVDDKLRASQILRPTTNPDAIYHIEGIEVYVWLTQKNIDPADIEDLVWVTVMTRSNH